MCGGDGGRICSAGGMRNGDFLVCSAFFPSEVTEQSKTAWVACGELFPHKQKSCTFEAVLFFFSSSCANRWECRVSQLKRSPCQSPFHGQRSLRPLLEGLPIHQHQDLMPEGDALQIRVEAVWNVGFGAFGSAVEMRDHVGCNARCVATWYMILRNFPALP